MKNSVKQVVSMLASDNAGKITLFTTLGEIIELPHDGAYDIVAITRFLKDNITGLEPVEIDLASYTTPQTPFSISDLADAGITMSTNIGGKTVQGFFYPSMGALQVDVDGEQVIIPDVDHLQSHMARAAADGSPSVINFFQRLARVIKQRKHSGEDLMKFIKKSEMPLTNSGRIIAYKRVTSCQKAACQNEMMDKHDHVNAENIDSFMVDTHSKKILQRVGSRVSMPVDMVDPSRHNSCSTGLHVANLGYLGGFSGDKTLIVLVDPENFIAVPKGEDTKARVCSYDIVGVMDANQHNKVCQGGHVDEDVSFANLIISAVEGTTIVPFEEVIVGEKEIKSLGTISLEAPAKIESKNETNGQSLKNDPVIEPPQERKTPRNLVKNLRDEDQAASIPDNVVKAFTMLKQGVSRKKVADHFETSTRSIGRWEEKHNFDEWELPLAKAVVTEEIEPEPEIAGAVLVQDTPRFDVYMQATGDRTIEVIKQIRMLIRCGLKEAMLLTKSLETPLIMNETQDGSDRIASSLRLAGATMTVVPHGATAPVPLPKKSNAARPPVTPATLAPPKTIKAPAAKGKTPLTLAEKARKLYDGDQYGALLEFKTSKKKSWGALGFTDMEAIHIKNRIA